MAVLEGKSPSERNKIIVAIVLGVLAIISLWLAFGPSFSSSGTTVTVSTSPTPTPAPTRELREVRMPTREEQNFDYQTTPVFYRVGMFPAPDPGRNIFAFYEPPPPCPSCPTPTPKPPPPPPDPTPPPITITHVTPQSVYAGSKAFRLSVNGDKFTPEARIYLSQSEMPTRYISAQRLETDIPANLIAMEGPRQVIVQTPDGKLYSNQVMLNVQAPPKPQFQYVGMIARQHANNDTAVFREQGKREEFSARLNDIVGGRFRLVSISAAETVFEDTNLGFRHKVELFRPPPGSTTSTFQPPTSIRGRGRPEGFEQVQPQTDIDTDSIPGIPDNIPRYVPPANRAPQPNETPNDSKTKDDNGEDTDGQ